MHIQSEIFPYVPEDFPLLQSSQEALDCLLAQIAGSMSDPEKITDQLDDIYPLAGMQAGMLFHSQVAPNSGVYISQQSLLMQGNFHLGAFIQSWQQLLASHPILRTGFVNANMPAQVVWRSVSLPLTVIDATHLAPEEQELLVSTYQQTDSQRDFVLHQPPLLRVTLFLLGPQHTRLLWTVHHAILDGWSAPLLLSELFTRYEALIQGQMPFVSARRPYRDYIDWLLQQDQKAAEQFWHEYLRGWTTPTSLPLIQSHTLPGHVPELHHRQQQITLSRQTSQQLQKVARDLRITVNVLLQASWAFVLSRYSGQTEVLFGMVVAGREAGLIGIESLIGLCVNTLPVRIALSGQAKVSDWLRNVHRQQALIQSFSYYPLWQIQQASELEPGQSLFESIFVFENYPANQLVEQTKQSSLCVSPLDIDARTNYPLIAMAFPGEQVTLLLNYQEPMIPQDLINRMLRLWQQVLEAIVTQPEQRVADLSPLIEEERVALAQWNATAQSYPQVCCVHQFFERQVEQHPDAIALVQGETQLTYAELNRRANQVAHYLRNLGAGPDTWIGICMERSLQMIVGVLGILKSGGALVPLEPTYPKERLAFMLADTQPLALLTQEALLPRLPDHACQVLCLEYIAMDLYQQSQDNLDSGVDEQNLAYVIYTSGSTGQAKGIAISQKTLSNMVAWQLNNFSWPSKARTLQYASLCFDISYQEMFTTWGLGGTLLLISEDLRRDPQELLSFLTYEAVERLFLPFVALQHVAECACSLNTYSPYLCEIITAGEQLRLSRSIVTLLEHVEDLNGCILHNQYGPSECHVVTAYTLSGAHKECSDLPPIGRPIANTQIYLLDQYMQPVPVGVSGEIYIGGDSLARGYLNRPELTAERFVPHPFSTRPGERLYRTGDLARYLEGGELEYQGRLDEQVKVRGFRIELGEIEAVLGQHPHVRECIVMVRDDSPGGKYLVAYVVPEQSAENSLKQLRSYLREKLPDYMVPSQFVQLEALPLTPHKKVDRRALPAPRIRESEEDGSRAVLYGPVEEILGGIWSDVLGVERVSLHESFFALGGHSLMAMQVSARIRQHFSLELPVRTLFEVPTLAELAQHIKNALHDRQSSDDEPPLLSIARTQPHPLSFAQQRLWFFDQLASGQPTYNVPIALHLQGHLDPAILETSLHQMEARHEILRMRIKEHDGQAIQDLLPIGSISLLWIDLSTLPPDELEEERQRLAYREAHHPFDLRQGPLWRVRLLRLSEQEWMLLVTMHHIITDGWSIPILLQELGQCYTALCEGKEVTLPALPIHYSDYAVWQRAWLQGERLQAQLAYWREQLANLVPLDIPTDHPRPANLGYRGSREQLHLPSALSQQVQTLSRQEGVTLFMTLLAGWLVVLQRYSGQTDLAVGTPVANRTHTDLEGLIGFFVNTLVLRCQIDGSRPARDLIRQVREITLQAYNYQELPFEQLVETLQPERDMSRHPLFQVMFALEPRMPNSLSWGTVTVRQVDEPFDVAKFDLTLAIEEAEQGLTASLEYNTELFEPETIKRMLKHWQRVLEAMVMQPEQSVADLPLLTEEEWQQQLVHWNATAQPYPQEYCVHQLFEQQVKRSPDAIALVQGEVQLSYEELNQRANQLAHYLQCQGVKAEVRVGLYVERSPEMIIAIIAVLKAGGAYVPVNVSLPQQRVLYQLQDAQVALVLTQEGLAETLQTCQTPLVCLDQAWQQFVAADCTTPQNQVQPDNLVYVIYTSGSTGRPKGVMNVHRGLGNYFSWLLDTYPLSPQDRVLQKASISFDASVSEIFWPLLSGACLVLASTDKQIDDSNPLQLIIEQQITNMQCVPALLRVLLEEPEIGRCKSLRRVFCGGEPLSSSLQEQFFTCLDAKLHNLYGPTEASIDVASWACKPVKTHSTGQVVPIGHPIANTQIYLLDRYMQPVPVGVLGELYIGGDGLSRGYLNRPDLTAERFVPHPFVGTGSAVACGLAPQVCMIPTSPVRPGERLYRTGDLARYRPDGAIEYLGRTDQQVKLRGVRIELGEIEAVLLQHPAVHEAVVLAQEDTSENKRLIAYLTLQPEQEQVELWPSIGEYFAYDEHTYAEMTHDEARNTLYKAVLEQMVAGKVVVDVGTGSDAILARLCVETGAKRVYAIELTEESYLHANARINQLGLQQQIKVLHGDATQIQIPERAEACVTEIFGAIGGAEGAGFILNNISHLLMPQARVVPRRSLTKIAAVRLPDELQEQPAFTELSSHYVQKIFEQVGYPFDVRLCIMNFPSSHLISDAELFEDLDCTGQAELEYSRQVQLTITQQTRLDGFLLWLVLDLAPGQTLDILQDKYSSWLPVYFPVFSPGIEVDAGDVIEMVSHCILSENGINPDYSIRGRLLRQHGEAIPFVWTSSHHQPHYRQTDFYQRLFSEDGVATKKKSHQRPELEEIRGHIRRYLPESMMPSSFVLLEHLPLLPNGKIDRQALPMPTRPVPAWPDERLSWQSPIEQVLAGIWQELLQVPIVSPHDHFFVLGGHSLVAMQVIARIRQHLGVALPIRTLFEAPLLAELAHLVEHALRGQQPSDEAPLLPVARTQLLPLSFEQQRLWFLDQFDPNQPIYNVPIILRLRGQLDPLILETSLHQLETRHEILRLRIDEHDGLPIQQWLPVGSRVLRQVDLSALSPQKREKERQRLVWQEAHTPFDLQQGPLWRACLLCLDRQEWVLLLTMHHIICDDWSDPILLQELGACYAAQSNGQQVSWSDLPLQYADYAVWQRSWLQGEYLRTQLEYWREQLANLVPLELPTDHPRPAQLGTHGLQELLRLSPKLSEQLQMLSRQEGVTLFMALLAGWLVVLQRYSGQSDLAIGTPIANRPRAELEGLIGFFVNTLVLRCQVKENCHVKDLLKLVREVALQAYSHQEVPFEQVVEALQLERDLSRHPLFQVMFVLQGKASPRLPWGTIMVQQEIAELDVAKFDLILTVQEDEQGMVANLGYNTDLFESETIKRMLKHWQRVLEAMVSQPEQLVADLPLLTEEEWQRQVVHWNATAQPYPQEYCVHQLFEQQVERSPDAIALVHGEEHISYEELNRRANQLAHYLQEQGVGPEIRVGICMERSPEMMVSLLAILKAGGAFVLLDPAYPKERLAFMLADTQPCVLLTQETYLPKFSDYSASKICLNRIAMRLIQYPHKNLVCSIDAQNLFCIIYTSGSTGQPKGIAMCHKTLFNLLCWQLEISTQPSKARTLQYASPSFDVSYQEMFSTWGSGGTLLLISEEQRRDAEGLLRFLTAEAVERLFLPFVVLQHLAEYAGSLNMYPRYLREVITAGEQLRLSQAIVVFLEHLEQISGCILYNQYGPAECHVVTAYTVQGARQEQSALPPIGRPIANTQIYLLDLQMQPVPVGALGEVYIGGNSLARGYLNRPEVTAERFVPNPFSAKAGERLYRTGDMARYLSDGAIEFVGRFDEQVKVRGYRIELGEIEAIVGQHEAVRECVVIARDDGPAGRYLVAYIVPQPSAQLSLEQVRSYLQEKLPDYMVPSWLVQLEALPLTPNRKVDRRGLPAPKISTTGGDKSTARLNGPVEEILEGIWAEVLRLERVGLHESFFALGGHSLVAMQVIARIRHYFGIDLPVRTLFEAPTLAELAQRVEQVLWNNHPLSDEPSLVPVLRTQSLPLSFAQQRLWFLSRFDEKQPTYNIPLVIRLQGWLDPVLLETCLHHLEARHENLRLRIEEHDGQASQQWLPVGSQTLRLVDLSALPLHEREAESSRLAKQESHSLFDLQQGPLWRAMLLQLTEQEWTLLLTVHHIIIDGWSLPILLRELGMCYTALSKGNEVNWSVLPIQYADYAVWQHAWLQGKRLQAQLEYWQTQLADLVPLELPTDHSRPALLGTHGSQEYLRLSSALFEQLQVLSRQEGVTLFMTLLAGWLVVLQRYSGQNDLVVGTPIANRPRAELEGLIGFFVNTLVLRCQIESATSVKDLLKQVREVALQAYSHQEVPFEQIVETVQAKRDLSRHPLFQVMFVLQTKATPLLPWGNITVQQDGTELDVAKFDLTLAVEEDEEGMVAALEYNTELFESETIKRMLGHWRQILEALVVHTEQRVKDLPLLTPEEQTRQLVEWNTTEQPYPHEVCLHHLFEYQVEQYSDGIALVQEEMQVTYAELNRRANQLAHYLQRRGVGPEIRVGLCMERSLEMIIAILAVLKAGGAYVPMDVSLPQQRLLYQLRDAQVVLVLTQERMQEILSPCQVPLFFLDREWDLLSGIDTINPQSLVQPDNLIYVIYTSGSTGLPKGVMIRQQSVVNYTLALCNLLGVKPNWRYATVSTLAADLGNTAIFCTLASGGCLQIPDYETILSAEAFAQWVSNWPVDVLKIVPSHLSALLSAEQIDAIFPNVALILGGEALPESLIALLRRQGCRCAIYNHYGPTETTVGVLVNPLGRLNTERETPAGEKTAIPLGHPIANTQIYLLDRHMQPVPIGVPGELYIGGKGLSRGYLNRADLTAERFVPNPFRNMEGSRLYRTGDLARYLPDGTIEYVGRLDYQIKIRGYRVELEEIEQVLQKQPAVCKAVVVVRENAMGTNQLVAYMTLNQMPQPSLTWQEDVQSYLRQSLPEYMVPSRFIALDTLPLTPSGKVDRQALQTQRCDDDTPATQKEQQPRNQTELQLLYIWERLLGKERISLTDNFFHLGGNSLSALRLLAEIQKEFCQRIPVAQLFQYPTIREIAHILHHKMEYDHPSEIEEGNGDVPHVSKRLVFSTRRVLDSALVPLQPRGSRLPFFCVHPGAGTVFCYLSLVKHLGTDYPVYGLQFPELDEGQTITSLEQLATHYLAAMQTVQPTGPYLLGGWSAGGPISFEMARQLRNRGQEVALLCMLDSYGPGSFVTEKGKKRYTVEEYLVELGWDEQEVRMLTEDEKTQNMYEICKKDLLVSDGLDLADVQHFIHNLFTVMVLGANYKPPCADQRITLIRVEPGKEYADVSVKKYLDLGDDVTYHWSEVAMGGVDVHMVPGTHKEILHEPYVQRVTSILKTCIDQVSQRP